MTLDKFIHLLHYKQLFFSNLNGFEDHYEGAIPNPQSYSHTYNPKSKAFDEKANEEQREALHMIFSGKAGGFMAEFAKLFGEVRETEYAPIKFEVAEDLSYWS